MSRTTLEIAHEALGRAKRALGLTRTKDTVDAALRRVADEAETSAAARAERQRHVLAALPVIEAPAHHRQHDGIAYSAPAAVRSSGTAELLSRRTRPIRLLIGRASPAVAADDRRVSQQ